MEELVLESDDASDEFSFDEPSEISVEADGFMGQFIDEDKSSEEIISEISSESDEFDFEAMSAPELSNESEVAAEFEELWITNESEKELNFDSSDEIANNSNEVNFEEFDFKETSITNASSDNILDDLGLDEEFAIADEPEPNEFMNELVDDNEPALNELILESNQENIAIADDSEPDEFILSFDNDNESAEQLNDDTISKNDSDLGELMGVFADDSQFSEDQSNASSDTFDLNFEGEDDSLDELDFDSLDAVDQKLDELTEISDDSLGELNDLLGSIQENNSTEDQKSQEVYQDQ